MICEAVEGSRRNMAHYSLMHMKIKSICQSIFSVNVFLFVLYHIFKQRRFLFRLCSIFLFPYIFLTSHSNHFEAVDFPVFAQLLRKRLEAAFLFQSYRLYSF